jgi:hypothetical protein
MGDKGRWNTDFSPEFKPVISSDLFHG